MGWQHITKSLLRVCKQPTHIEAREYDTKFDWTRSKTVLIHDSNPNPNTFNPNPKWAFGVSKDFGLVKQHKLENSSF